MFHILILETLHVFQLVFEFGKHLVQEEQGPLFKKAIVYQSMRVAEM